MTRAQAIAAAMVFRNKQAALEHEGRATLPPAPETATASADPSPSHSRGDSEDAGTAPAPALGLDSSVALQEAKTPAKLAERMRAC